jgi:hypothetical protein
MEEDGTTPQHSDNDDDGMHCEDEGGDDYSTWAAKQLHDSRQAEAAANNVTMMAVDDSTPQSSNSNSQSSNSNSTSKPVAHSKNAQADPTTAAPPTAVRATGNGPKAKKTQQPEQPAVKSAQDAFNEIQIKRFQQGASRVPDQILFAPAAIVRPRADRQAAEFFINAIIVWAPSLQFGCEMKCFTADCPATVKRNGWSDVRRLHTEDGIIFFTCTVHKCPQHGSFLASRQDCLRRLPDHVRKEFPVFLSQKDGMTTR